ncbi:hypothetical protein G5B46_19075 [Caulobacter sp. 602-2]|uniref:Uncharacterized protein n=1 Tax=Caulobacter sp. 602-2 TaxID=2710887 RepID=A0A6G4R1H3_9CAUL|nr:hypothetical protein [Caulobacter sp. 602-2]NGM51720.1 hypothetical protein [Caulobacter sp. 602-2]
MASWIIGGALALLLSSPQETLTPAPRPTGGEAVHALKADGPLTVRPAGRAAVGDALVALPVRLAFTGVLSQDVLRDGRVALPAGTRVIGVRQSFSSVATTREQRRLGQIGQVHHGGNQTIWCAATSAPSKDAAACLPFVNGVVRWVEASPPHYPIIRRFTPKAPLAGPVLVEPGPIEGLAPLRFTIAFAGWTPEGAAIDLKVESDGRPPATRRRTLARGPDGAATLEALGGRLRLIPVAADANVADIEIVIPPSATADPEF